MIYIKIVLHVVHVKINFIQFPLVINNIHPILINVYYIHKQQIKFVLSVISDMCLLILEKNVNIMIQYLIVKFIVQHTLVEH